MSQVPFLNGLADPSDRTRSASSFQYIYDQIDALRRQTASTVEKGALGPAEGEQITGRLSAIEESIDKGVADRSMTRSDLRGLNEELHDIRKSIVHARRMAAEAEAPAGAEGENPNPRPPRALDISV